VGRVSSEDLTRWLVELVVALGGGGGVAYLLTLRQRRALLSARAFDVITTAAGRIVEQSADMVPTLTERITRLEASAELRQLRVEAMSAELDEVHTWAGEAVRWMGNAVRLIAELGGNIDAPPPAPERRPFPRPAPPSSGVVPTNVP
jgi:hypothetical protein